MATLVGFMQGLVARGADHGWQAFGSGSQWDTSERGQDFGLDPGTPIPASAGTIVAVSSWCTDSLVSEQLPDGTVLSVGHVTPNVHVGQHVNDGDVLGYSAGAASSCSSGPHVEFQVQPGGGAYVDPLPWLSGANGASGTPTASDALSNLTNTLKSLPPSALVGGGIVALALLLLD